MFDFTKSIHMLEFVLWLGCVGAEDLGLRSQKSRLQGVDSIHGYIHDYLDEWLQTCHGYHFDPAQSNGYDHTVGLFILILSMQMVAPMSWVYFIWSFEWDGCIHANDPCTWSFSWWITALISCIHVLLYASHVYQAWLSYFRYCTCMFELQVFRCWYSNSSLHLKSF